MSLQEKSLAGSGLLDCHRSCKVGQNSETWSGKLGECKEANTEILGIMDKTKMGRRLKRLSYYEYFYIQTTHKTQAGKGSLQTHEQLY